MSKLVRMLKAGAKGFTDAFAPAPYLAAGLPVTCPHCHGETFRQQEALLNTTGNTLVNLDWLDKSGTALLCENCGLVQWFTKVPQRQSPALRPAADTPPPAPRLCPPGRKD